MLTAWLQLEGQKTSTELADVIPVIKTSIAGTRIIGRLCAGNKNGFLFPTPPQIKDLNIGNSAMYDLVSYSLLLLEASMVNRLRDCGTAVVIDYDLYGTGAGVNVTLEPEVQGYDSHFALEHVNSRTHHVYYVRRCYRDMKLIIIL
ncbi:hypothetical protein CRYUN_Cryun01aG0067100 [Craigia yunnanensis]